MEPQKALILWLGLSVLWYLWALIDTWRKGHLRETELYLLLTIFLICPILFPWWFLRGLFVFVIVFIREFRKPSV